MSPLPQMRSRWLDLLPKVLNVRFLYMRTCAAEVSIIYGTAPEGELRTPSCATALPFLFLRLFLFFVPFPFLFLFRSFSLSFPCPCLPYPFPHGVTSPVQVAQPAHSC